jgi:hypothetical protein
MIRGNGRHGSRLRWAGMSAGASEGDLALWIRLIGLADCRFGIGRDVLGVVASDKAGGAQSTQNDRRCLLGSMRPVPDSAM